MHQGLGQNEEDRAPLLVWLGVALLAAGVFVALFVASEVLGVYQDPDSNEFIRYLTDRLLNSEPFVADSPVVIGDGGATITAFVLSGLIAWIGAGIGFSFIRVGYELSSGYLGLKLTAARTKIKEKVCTD